MYPTYRTLAYTSQCTPTTLGGIVSDMPARMGTHGSGARDFGVLTQPGRIERIHRLGGGVATPRFAFPAWGVGGSGVGGVGIIWRSVIIPQRLNFLFSSHLFFLILLYKGPRPIAHCTQRARSPLGMEGRVVGGVRII